MAIDVEELYRRYGPMVLRRCRGMLRNEAEAVDAMHDVFVELLRRRDTIDSSGSSSLLYRVATNVCLNRLRSRTRRKEEPGAELLERIAVASAEERSQAKALLDRLLSREPVSSGTIAVLHLHDGLTLEEVAQQVGLSVSGVRKRLRRLEERLRELEVEAKP
ncbi:MAG: sigma-70 family RNA polymerase sigma factor [Myxococcales bacterium]|nr:sigma-70 family RNA polymerase sigma factor [Myxococcales bacterium]